MVLNCSLVSLLFVVLVLRSLFFVKQCALIWSFSGIGPIREIPTIPLFFNREGLNRPGFLPKIAATVW